LISKKDSGFLKDCLLKNDEPLPKLDDALKLLENFKGTIFVESKMPEYEKKILFLIKKHSLANHSVFESFNFESLKRARMLDKKIRLLYTLWIPTRKSLKKAKSINCYALAPPAWSLRKRFVQSAKKEKIKIYAFDVKTKTLLKRVRSLDIDGIFADKYY
jgi:glycerophosphoryl diester phosphodiesterase